MILARDVSLLLDNRIFAEYHEVLFRPEFPFPGDRVREVLDFLWIHRERVQAQPLPIHLPDPDDVMFIEVAVAGVADALVTGNPKHFPASQRRGVRVLTPREWLAFWAGEGYQRMKGTGEEDEESKPR
jgi:predicted nucleic acid-binding protein